MAKKVMRRPGGVPSANRKIVTTNKKLGVNGIQNMQGTTRVILDAVPLAPTTTKTTLTLFENCKNRQFPLTNLTENKLQVGESIAVEQWTIFIMQTLTATGQLLSVFPLSYFPQFHRHYGAFLSFSIAQDQVIKKQPLQSMFSVFNPNAKFMGLTQQQPAAGDLATYNYSQDIYRTKTDLIIPPQIEFVASLEVPAIDLPAGAIYSWHMAMMIEGLGSLFAPKSTY